MKAVKKVAATIMGISAGILMSGAAVSDSFHFNNCKREQDNDKGNHLIFDRYPSRCDFQGRDNSFNCRYLRFLF